MAQLFLWLGCEIRRFFALFQRRGAEAPAALLTSGGRFLSKAHFQLAEEVAPHEFEAA